jgi:hypothetical protein
MFNNGFKATIRRLVSLPFQDVTNLLTWSDGKDVDFGNGNLLVASAAKNGKTTGYLVAEPTLLVSHYTVSPETTLAEAHQIGDVIDAAFEVEARKIGADRFMMVLPAEVPTQPDEICLRVIVRKIPQKATTIGSPIDKFSSNETSTPNFIN